MALFDNLLTVFILFALFLIMYLKITNKTLPEFFTELKEMFSNEEEVLQ